MTIPDILLDTSWSIHFVPATRRRMPSLQALFSVSRSHEISERQLKVLGEQCSSYIQSQNKQEPIDELNDDNVKMGTFRECVVSQVLPHDSISYSIRPRHAVGLAVETRYQKTTYQVMLLARKDVDSEDYPLVAVLYRASQKNLKHVKDWLEATFSLPLTVPLNLPPAVLAQMCTKYLATLASAWPVTTDATNALRAAILKQAIGNLKLTIAFTTASNIGIAPNLKTVDIDLPSETVGEVLARTRDNQRDGSGGSAFLDELANAIYEKTGLRLPLTGTHVAAMNENSEDQSLTEGPLKVTKMTCAAFAVSVEGKIKLASKPVNNAPLIGYEEDLIRRAYWEMLEIIRGEAEKRAADSNG